MDITLEQVKADLKVTHALDDNAIELALAASINETLQFMNRAALPVHTSASSDESSSELESSEPLLEESMYAAVFLLVRAKYEAPSADEIQRLRACAEMLLQPFRVGLGV